MNSTWLAFLRIAAFLIDATLVHYLVFVVSVLAPTPVFLAFRSHAEFLLLLAYFTYCHCMWGRTVGKWALRIRVAGPGGLSPLPLREASLRNLPLLGLYTLGLLLPEGASNQMRLGTSLWFLADGLAMFASGGFRSIHDSVARTFVTREQSKRRAQPDAQHNAVTRPSPGDSPAFDTPSSPAPRG